MKLRRFWIKFDLRLEDAPPVGVLAGCGVTAFSREDAHEIIGKQIFAGNVLPGIQKEIEDVDVSTLDPRHVRPNIGDPTKRGVWFPLGY
jgi:hypothetical protein